MLGTWPWKKRLMAQRDRAWRRRKARTVIAKVKATKDWLLKPFLVDEPKARPHAAQKARAWWSTEQELRDGFIA